MPERRGTPVASEKDVTGVAVKFQRQPFEVVRYCVRKRQDPGKVVPSVNVGGGESVLPSLLGYKGIAGEPLP